jgi:peptidyl-prolyl cis-trans isomerase SurA
MWGERCDAYIVTCSQGTDVTGVRKAYKKISKGKFDQDKLNALYCNNDTLPCITLTHYLVERGENTMIDERFDISGPGPITDNEGMSTFVIVKGVRSPEPKKLHEARGQITSDYQESLESDWLKALKEKYPVTVNQDLLKSIKP